MLPVPGTEVRFNELITALKERDFRLTPQQVELVRLIASSEGHPSAAKLYARIARKRVDFLFYFGRIG